MDDIVKFIFENKERIFSWIWVTVLIALWNIFFKKNNIKQTQTGWNNSNMQQAGRDIINK